MLGAGRSGGPQHELRDSIGWSAAYATANRPGLPDPQITICSFGETASATASRSAEQDVDREGTGIWSDCPTPLGS